MTDIALQERAGRGGEPELVDAFEQRALAIAGSAAAPNTRRSYATAYREFAAFLHAGYGEASLATFTVTTVAAWRDELTAQGLAASTVAQRVSAVRRLAAALGADPLVARAPPHPPPLSFDDLDRDLIAALRGDHGDHNRLGFGVELATLQFLGTFLAHPVDVLPVVARRLRASSRSPTPPAWRSSRRGSADQAANSLPRYRARAA